MKITVALMHGYGFTELGLLAESTSYAMQKIMQDSWDNRPQYDEDAGVFVSTKKDSTLYSAAMFSLLGFCKRYDDLFYLTDREHDLLNGAYDLYTNREDPKETDSLPEIQVTREVERDTDLPCLIQLLFLYMEDMGDIYSSKERDLYDSDNHYTGKPLSYFLEEAKKKVIEDRKKIYRLVDKLSKLTK